MSRTISEIYNQMLVEKETFSDLNQLTPLTSAYPTLTSAQKLLIDLTSTSKVAIWRLIFYVCAVAIWIFENQIENIVNRAVASTQPWWINTIKAFQYGDTLTWNGQSYSYATINPTKQIVTQCSISTSNGIMYIKVATGTTTLSALTDSQLTSLRSYINLIMPVGTSYVLISNTADLLQLVYTVYIDTTIIYYNSSNPNDALNGSLLSDPTTFPIVNAINNYIQYLDVFNFSGVFFVSKLTDAIQSVTGVSNVVANIVYAKYGSLPYTNVLLNASQSYVANAGYLQIDPASPLAYPNLNYLPK